MLPLIPVLLILILLGLHLLMSRKMSNLGRYEFRLQMSRRRSRPYQYRSRSLPRLRQPFPVVTLSPYTWHGSPSVRVQATLVPLTPAACIAGCCNSISLRGSQSGAWAIPQRPVLKSSSIADGFSTSSEAHSPGLIAEGFEVTR